MLDLLADLWAFMRERKKFWLAPIIVVKTRSELRVFSLSGVVLATLW
jgi:hypothetical protein